MYLKNENNENKTSFYPRFYNHFTDYKQLYKLLPIA